jgi:glycosyltransferase involved in cell wall biosynthesis
MPYRRPFFEMLRDRYEIDFFIFDDENEATVEADMNYECVDRKEIYKKIHDNSYDYVITPDITTTESWISILAVRNKQTKIVQWTEIWDMPNRSLYHQVKSATAFRIFDRWIDSYIVPGSRSKKYVLKHTHSNATDVYRVPNASHIKGENSQETSRKDLDIASNATVILYCCRLVPLKGVHTFLKSIAILEEQHDNISVLIAGDGDAAYKTKLKSLVDDLNLQSVRFLGWINEKDIYDIYRISDIYALLSRKDPYPLSVVEAMSTGSPVVVSDGVGQAFDIVRDGETGYVVRIENPEDAASAISVIVSNKHLREEMSYNSEETVKRMVNYQSMITGLDRAMTD